MKINRDTKTLNHVPECTVLGTLVGFALGVVVYQGADKAEFLDAEGEFLGCFVWVGHGEDGEPSEASASLLRREDGGVELDVCGAAIGLGEGWLCGTMGDDLHGYGVFVHVI